MMESVVPLLVWKEPHPEAQGKPRYFTDTAFVRFCCI